MSHDTTLGLVIFAGCALYALLFSGTAVGMMLAADATDRAEAREQAAEPEEAAT